MIVIYTADVEAAQDIYDLGGITLKIESAYLVNMNSNHIYQKLRFKIENQEPLIEEELMELMILPLTAKGTEAKQEYIRKAVELAKKMPNQNDVHTVIAGLLTFTDKFIETIYAEKLRRELTMLTKVEQIIFDEACEWIRKELQTPSRKPCEITYERFCEETHKRFAQEAQEKALKETVTSGNHCSNNL
ncbi:MAG: hypothetical protein IJ374_12065 [Lachnospiraceae bacterium]|nr:hypothetical protein [Lachnospiraceae bacterium]